MPCMLRHCVVETSPQVGLKVHMSSRQSFRKLVAVLAADMVGYSGLMGHDEEATYEMLVGLRSAVLDPEIARSGGELIKNTGDGFLAAYPSAVAAVECALAIQTALAMEVTGPGLHPVRFRIGITVCQAIFDQGDIYGDGVNIAARLQSYAEPGGILVTAAVVDQTRGTLSFQAVDLGDLLLKNIGKAIRVFALRYGGALQPNQPLVRLSDGRPSLAVLPFRHSGLAENNYFAEGVVGDIIRALAQMRELLVISHSTTLRYAGLAMNVEQVAEELGVQYVLSGSLARGDERLLITTDLSHAASSVVIWTDRFEIRIDHLFQLQDRIATQVAGRVVPHLRQSELRRGLRKHPENMDAYDFFLQGLDLLYRMETEAFSRARGMLQRSISLDPNYARPYAYVAKWHIFRVGQGWSHDHGADTAAAAEFAAAAYARDQGDALAQAILGHVHSFLMKDPATGSHYLEEARSMSPSDAMAWALSSSTATYLGHSDQAIEQAAEALRLAPRDAHAFFYEETMALAQYWAGHYDQAIDWAERSARHNRAFSANLRCLVGALVAVGRRADARRWAEVLLSVEPGFNLRDFRIRSPFQQHPDHESFLSHLVAAGLPEVAGSIGTDQVALGYIPQRKLI